MAQYNRVSWVYAATRGVARGKEHSQIWRELSEHIEDHTEALMAAGFSKEEAECRAVTAMGDPRDTAKLLRRVHQPVLTQILHICKTLLFCGTVLWLFYVWITHPFAELQMDSCCKTISVWSVGNLTQDILLDPAPPEEYPASYRRSKSLFQQARVGDCLFTVTRASVSRVDWYLGGTRYPWIVVLELEIAPARFAQRPKVQGSFTMVNDQGVEANSRMNDGTELIDAHQYREGRTCVHTLIADFPTDSRWVDVTYTDAENTFTLRVDLEGETVYEAPTS